MTGNFVFTNMADDAHVENHDILQNEKTLSEYTKTLDPKTKHRYIDKLSLCNGIDPYVMKTKEFSQDFNDLPSIEFPDISNYLVIHTSFYTGKQMKAFKSLEAYNYFVCGLVHDVGVKVIKDENRLIFGRVTAMLFCICLL